MGGIPARRHLALPWFTLVAEIRPDSDDVYPFTRTEFIWEAPRAGGLYLYVNDAINPGIELTDLNVADADGLPISEAERASARTRGTPSTSTTVARRPSRCAGKLIAPYATALGVSGAP